MTERPDKKNNYVEKRDCLTPDAIEMMMVGLCRSLTAFSSAKRILTSKQLHNSSPLYGLIWNCLIKHHTQFNDLPDYDQLRLLVDESQSVVELNDVEAARFNEFMDLAFDKDVFKGNPEKATPWILDKVSSYIHEQVAIKASQELLERKRVPKNLHSVLSKLREDVAQASTLSHTGSTKLYSEGWDERIALTLRPTNVVFLDKNMGGGPAIGEGILILGPYGSGKTTLALQAAAAAISESEVKSLEYPDAPDEVHVHVTYEAGKTEIATRMLSAGAKISYGSVRAMRSMADLRSEGLHDYERELFKREMAALVPNIPTEAQRARAHMKRANRFMEVLDFSGKDPDNANAGKGFVPEIVAEIERRLSERKKPAIVRGVWIDYALQMVRRYCNGAGLPADSRRNILDDVGMLCITEIGARFQCPVFILHQLDTKANKSEPGRRLTAADGAECKSMGENMSFSFVIGKPNEKNQFVWWVDKHRREPPRPYSILQVHDTLSMIVDVSNKFDIDDHTHGIRERVSDGMLT